MDSFDKLPQDKQGVVLRAAFSCFGANGYRKTSIADIAKQANISKASVFQYFGTKKDLYRYLYQFAIQSIKDELVPESDDFFENLKAAAAVKIRVISKFPGMFNFLSSVASETDSEVTDVLHERHVLAETEYYHKNVNWEKLKPGVDREMLLNLLGWINEGYLRTMPPEQTLEEKVTGIFRYLGMIRVAVYKEEYLL